jgi:hypothetical protein
MEDWYRMNKKSPTVKVWLICLVAISVIILYACSRRITFYEPTVTTHTITEPVATRSQVTGLIKSPEIISSTQNILVLDTVRILQIEPGNLISKKLVSANYGVGDHFLWSSDGKLLYYYLWYTSTNDNNVQYSGWAAYNIATQTSITVSPPITNKTPVWQKLGIDPPKDSEFRGLISPSGKHVIYPIFLEKDEFNPYGRGEVWLASLDKEDRTRLLEIGYPPDLARAEWLPDESRVFFSIILEAGGSAFYTTEIQTGKTDRLEDYLNFKGLLYSWVLSPDGTTLAGVSRDSMNLIDLESRQIKNTSELAINLQWSKDNRKIFYWMGGPDQESCFNQKTKDIRVYDRFANKSSTLVDTSVFKKNEDLMGISLTCQPFSISPDENHIVIGLNKIWMLVLNGK